MTASQADNIERALARSSKVAYPESQRSAVKSQLIELVKVRTRVSLYSKLGGAVPTALCCSACLRPSMRLTGRRCIHVSYGLARYASAVTRSYCIALCHRSGLR